MTIHGPEQWMLHQPDRYDLSLTRREFVLLCRHLAQQRLTKMERMMLRGLVTDLQRRLQHDPALQALLPVLR